MPVWWHRVIPFSAHRSITSARQNPGAIGHRGEGEARLRADLRDPLLGNVEVVGNVDRSQLFHGGRLPDLLEALPGAFNRTGARLCLPPARIAKMPRATSPMIVTTRRSRAPEDHRECLSENDDPADPYRDARTPISIGERHSQDSPVMASAAG